MTKPTFLQAFARSVLIIIILLVLILGPRPAAGYLDLRQARWFYATGNYAAAAAAYASAAGRLPWLPALWEKAGDAYLNGENYTQAEYAYKLADQRQALSSNGYLSWGDSAFALGDAKFAIDLWNKQMGKGISPSKLLPRIARGYQYLRLYSEEIQAWQ